jgi:FkbM family methyltransferase
MKLEYLPGSKNHSLLILKEIFLNNIYTFTKATDQKLKSLQEKDGGEGVILDIGANIGIATAYFKDKYPNIRVIAIEASPINYNQLIKNIEVNKFKNIVTINKFVSRKNEQICFYHLKHKPGGSFGEGYKFADPSVTKEFDVETIKIDDVIKGLKNIVIKIDVEGAEYEILEDLALSENVSEVLEITAEVSTFNQADYEKLNMVLNSFYNLGFEPRFISDYGITHLKNKSKQGHLQLTLLKV